MAERHAVQAEDAQRLNRLSEEVQARLGEIAAIATRVGADGADGVGEIQKFTTRAGTRGAAGSVTEAETSDWMEIIDAGEHQIIFGSIGGKSFIEFK